MSNVLYHDWYQYKEYSSTVYITKGATRIRDWESETTVEVSFLVRSIQWPCKIQDWSLTTSSAARVLHNPSMIELGKGRHCIQTSSRRWIRPTSYRSDGTKTIVWWFSPILPYTCRSEASSALPLQTPVFSSTCLIDLDRYLDRQLNP